MKNSQISLEFMMFMGISMVIAIIFAAMSAKNISSYNKELEEKALIEIGEYIQKEIMIASYMSDGYFRTAEIPQTVFGNNFSVINYNKSFVIKYKQTNFSFSIPEKKGNITKGDNNINKTNGTVYIS